MACGERPPCQWFFEVIGFHGCLWLRLEGSVDLRLPIYAGHSCGEAAVSQQGGCRPPRGWGRMSETEGLEAMGPGACLRWWGSAPLRTLRVAAGLC